MSISHMTCSSGRLPVSLVNLVLKSPIAPSLSVEPGTIEHSRKSMDFFGKIMPVARGVKIQSISYGGVPCQQHQPRKAPSNRVLLYFHGGGYCVGSPLSHRHLIARLAKQSKMRAVAPDYRKAPEHTHPAPIEDAVNVYSALLEEGVKPENIYLAGDSAGGNLVLATLIRLRDLSIALPAAACCISPWTDLSMSGETIASKGHVDLLLTPELLRQFASHYSAGVSAEQRGNSSAMSPLAADLTGLPPLLIQVGSEEILLDDSVRLAEHAKRDGVAVELQIWEKMQHVWHYTFPMLKDGRIAISEIAAFFDRNQ
ncbi:MAG: alpha/beta hydrolase [Pseudomonadales bacterium]|jgi:epsilon-lactone hydrolase|uniref:alpha/beta hydrolase n=1 Tax=unclassified Ketobacter TaxID=2639109 RepID=UPI000C5CCBF9|nr:MULTISPECIES: alpha/beta hydrolase [unclassified Ketobacter]MAQ25901.1 alpha/beta hydrolase [Pseudomonadales bacterium]MEC8810877.1 alpha/beta hydrolase [Pseudomonadota bacterium]TNC88875.1 MAG: alpha/beta hydrolase [Alcanivorax sp.]HAG93907.1 alpha/beta hydrolase [Gammaproteobacteria bacterium]MBI27996.1 alpha/beta hydrolase [Pseudomonadales bacterium]|tara:strand:+ start:29040 stop:29978 length:939 start_codon:yes stop_codon:yes gene_type:complete